MEFADAVGENEAFVGECRWHSDVEYGGIRGVGSDSGQKLVTRRQLGDHVHTVILE